MHWGTEMNWNEVDERTSNLNLNLNLTLKDKDLLQTSFRFD